MRSDAAKGGVGLRALYRTLDLPGKNPLKDAHAALDEAVVKAYGFAAKKDLLQQMLDLNSEVAELVTTGKIVSGPGLPGTFKSPASAVSDDCFGV